MSQESKAEAKPLVVKPNEGRVYPMGRMSAIFKADGNETSNTNLSVSVVVARTEYGRPT